MCLKGIEQGLCPFGTDGLKKKGARGGKPPLTQKQAVKARADRGGKKQGTATFVKRTRKGARGNLYRADGDRIAIGFYVKTR